MHKSVLLQETIELLALKEGQTVLDGTVGAGGHSYEILKKIGTRGVLIGIDQDETALNIARKRLSVENVILKKGNFMAAPIILKKLGIAKVDRIILDLGVSSMQLDEAERGFSFSKHALLDMRMDKEGTVTAQDVINTYSETDLIRIFREYGEEKMAKRIAKSIVAVREQEPITYTDQLAEVVRGVKRTEVRRGQKKIDPATKVFQALRIEVNDELKVIKSALPQLVDLLVPGGRLAVISFHSLEDRIVKQFIEEESKDCVCPPDSPVCRCSQVQRVKKITRKPVVATEQEISENPRSRSAKLRVLEKI